MTHNPLQKNIFGNSHHDGPMLTQDTIDSSSGKQKESDFKLKEQIHNLFGN